MTLEHRLQHAARELREVHIDVPPLGGRRPAHRRSRLATIGAPLLVPAMFVVGALFAISATQGTATPPTQSDVTVAQTAEAPPPPSAVETQDTPAPATVAVRSAPTAPSVLAELAIIAELVSRQLVDDAAGIPSDGSRSNDRAVSRTVSPI